VGEKFFDSVEKLREQIFQDISIARKLIIGREQGLPRHFVPRNDKEYMQG